MFVKTCFSLVALSLNSEVADNTLDVDLLCLSAFLARSRFIFFWREGMSFNCTFSPKASLSFPVTGRKGQLGTFYDQ